MPLPEGYRPRKGDVLVVHMAVDYVGDTYLKLKAVHPDGDWQESHYFKPEVVVGVKRRRWEESEEVRLRERPRVFGKVIATHDDLVWLDLDDESDLGPALVVHCNELEPLPVADEVQATKPGAGYPIPEHPGIAPRSHPETDDDYRARILEVCVGDVDQDEHQRIAAAAGLNLDAIGARYRVLRAPLPEGESL